MRALCSECQLNRVLPSVYRQCAVQDSHSLYMVMELVQGGEFFTYLQVTTCVAGWQVAWPAVLCLSFTECACHQHRRNHFVPSPHRCATEPGGAAE